MGEGYKIVVNDADGNEIVNINNVPNITVDELFSRLKGSGHDIPRGPMNVSGITPIGQVKDGIIQFQRGSPAGRSRIRYTPNTPQTPPSASGPRVIASPESTVGSTGQIFQKAGTCTSRGQNPISVLIRSDNDPSPIESQQDSAGGSGDIALLIDTSGSMYGTELEEAKKASLLFLKELEKSGGGPKGGLQSLIGKKSGGYRVGLISFGMNSRAEILHGLTTDYSELKKSIHSMQADNGTPMADAVNLAHSKLLTMPGTIVLMTDGGASGVEPEAKAAKRKNHQFISVGVTGANMTLLKKLATSPSDCHYCTDPIQLGSKFVEIAQGIRSTSAVVHSRSGKGGAEVEYDAEIVRVIRANPHMSSMSTGGSEIPEGHGFNNLNITTFVCVCGENQLDICPFCGHMLCASEALENNSTDVTCAACQSTFQVEESDSAAAGGLSAGGGKK